VPDHILESGDSPDLEALFDSIASQQKEVEPVVTAPSADAAGSPQHCSDV
jgi:chemotaxis protein CheZ